MCVTTRAAASDSEIVEKRPAFANPVHLIVVSSAGCFCDTFHGTDHSLWRCVANCIEVSHDLITAITASPEYTPIASSKSNGNVAAGMILTNRNPSRRLDSVGLIRQRHPVTCKCFKDHVGVVLETLGQLPTINRIEIAYAVLLQAA